MVPHGRLDGESEYVKNVAGYGIADMPRKGVFSQGWMRLQGVDYLVE
jgi:hypothetical protein